MDAGDDMETLQLRASGSPIRLANIRASPSLASESQTPRSSLDKPALLKNTMLVNATPPTQPPTPTANVEQPSSNAALDDKLDEIPLLKQQLSAVPTESRRVAAVKDMARCTVALVPYLVMQVVRYVLAKFGFSEHRWKGVPSDLPLTAVGRKHLLDLATALMNSSTLDVQSLLHTGPGRTASSNTVLSSQGSGPVEEELGSAAMPTSAALINHLQDVIGAVELTAQQQGLKMDEAFRRGVARDMAGVLVKLAAYKAVNTQDVLYIFRHKGKKSIRQLVKQKPGLKSSLVVDEFLFHLLMRNSLRIPPQQKGLLMRLPDGSHLIETTTLISLSAGREFLRCQGPVHEDQVSFMEQYPQLRPSSCKREWLAQATTINARLHALCVQRPDGTSVQIASHLRSGAFAMHGRRPKGIGLSGLMEAAQVLAAEDDAGRRAQLLDQLGYPSIESLEPEIRIRSTCCVAQALPVIAASLQQAIASKRCWESAFRTGTFLHIQQSLLSDLNGNEHSYLQDTQAALELLSSRVEVRLSSRPVTQLSVDKATQRITLTLDSDGVPDDMLPLAEAGGTKDATAARAEVLGRSYRLQAVLFSQGVNVLQSLGFFRVGDKDEILQDKLNSHALDTLNSYAARAGRASTPALVALNEHLSRGGRRLAKDTQLVHLVRRAATELGGMRAVNCKSGKDRTAIELSIAASEQAVEAGLVPAEQQPILQAAWQSGLSYRMTGENNGQPNAYAFSELELVCMPPGWRPFWQLCGKVLS